jgi:rubredoxin
LSYDNEGICPECGNYATLMEPGEQDGVEYERWKCFNCGHEYETEKKIEVEE